MAPTRGGDGIWLKQEHRQGQAVGSHPASELTKRAVLCMSVLFSELFSGSISVRPPTGPHEDALSESTAKH